MPYFMLGCAVVLYVFQNFFCSRYATVTKTSPHLSSFVYTVYISVILSIATLIVTLIKNGGTLGATPTTFLIAIFTAASLITYYFSMVGATRTGSYVFLMVCTLFGGIIVPAVVDCIIMKSFLSLTQTIGVIIMLIAVVVFNVDFRAIAEKKKNGGQESEKTEKTKPIYYLYCLLLFISNGAYSAFLGMQQRLENNLHSQEMVMITYLLSAFVCFIFVLLSKNRKSVKEEFAIGKPAALRLGIAAASSTAALNITLFVLSKLDPTVVFTVDNGGNMFLAALLSYIVLKEKYELNKIIATALVIASIIILCVF